MEKLKFRQNVGVALKLHMDPCPQVIEWNECKAASHRVPETFFTALSTKENAQSPKNFLSFYRSGNCVVA